MSGVGNPQAPFHAKFLNNLVLHKLVFLAAIGVDYQISKRLLKVRIQAILSSRAKGQIRPPGQRELLIFGSLLLLLQSEPLAMHTLYSGCSEVSPDCPIRSQKSHAQFLPAARIKRLQGLTCVHLTSDVSGIDATRKL